MGNRRDCNGIELHLSAHPQNFPGSNLLPAALTPFCGCVVMTAVAHGKREARSRVVNDQHGRQSLRRSHGCWQMRRAPISTDHGRSDREALDPNRPQLSCEFAQGDDRLMHVVASDVLTPRGRRRARSTRGRRNHRHAVSHRPASVTRRNRTLPPLDLAWLTPAPISMRASPASIRKLIAAERVSPRTELAGPARAPAV